MMAPELRIRSADPDDAEIVREIAVRAFAEYRDLLDPPPGILFESVEIIRFAITNQVVVLAEIGDCSVGTARLELRPTGGYIGRFAVLPGYRGQGIATHLMDHLEARAAASGRLMTTVTVREALPANIHFFEHRGYTVTNREPHPRIPTTVTITLTKTLASASIL
ncbi:MAG TPA: GNAT family N-acetyltransferase [Thermomicrobiales bacterium]|nr:GNAT family N-acetyltransferase [Thermomicrobiales bacterium]